MRFISPNALGGGTLLIKPGDFLCLAGETHGTGRERRRGLEVDAQKVEAARDAADEGFGRMLLQPEVGEHLVHHAHRPAELPAGLGKDDPIIHETEVADPGEGGHRPVQGG
jgi:hypothetical protein